MTIGGQCCGIYKRNAVLYCASIGALSPSVQNGDGEQVADAHLERHALDDRTPERPLPWEPKTVADADFQQQVQLLSASAPTSR